MKPFKPVLCRTAQRRRAALEPVKRRKLAAKQRAMPFAEWRRKFHPEYEKS